MEKSDIRDRLVLAALPHVVFDGWSHAALAAAAEDEALDPTTPARAFPGGAVDAVAHLIALADRLMAQDVAALDLDGARVSTRVFTAIKVRLERWAPHREAIRRALAILAMPQNLGLAATLTWKTADAIWRAAGDASHDFSWYTRRATLAGVYSATVLYWLDDASEDFADTQAFLKRRLADVNKVTQARKRLSGVLPQLGLLAAKGRRFGINR